MAGAVEKAFRVVRLLRQSPRALSVSEVARAAKMAPSTAHGILAELASQGVLHQDADRRYSLGPAVFYLGAAYVRNAPIYRGVWSPLVELAHDLALTAVIAVPWEEHHLILSVHRDGPPEVDVAFGGRVPLDAGAWGKSYFAWSGATPPLTLQAHTPDTITDLEAYQRELAQVRERGYATDAEEFASGAGGVASAVTSEHGFQGVAALVGPISSFNQLGFDETGRRLAAVASRASYALGDRSRVRLVGVDDADRAFPQHLQLNGHRRSASVPRANRE